MIDLNAEAKAYELEYYRDFLTNKDNGHNGLNDFDGYDIKDASIYGFIGGANSKYVQSKILQAKIDVLLEFKDSDMVDKFYILMEEFNQQLDELKK